MEREYIIEWVTYFTLGKLGNLNDLDNETLMDIFYDLRGRKKHGLS